MADGWRQAWADLLDSLHGRSPRSRQDRLSSDPASLDQETDVVRPGGSQESSSLDQGNLSAPGSTDLSAEVSGSEGDQDHRISTDDNELIRPKTSVPKGSAIPGDQFVEPRRLDRRWVSTVVAIILLIGVFWLLSPPYFVSDLLAPDPPAPDVVATFTGGSITMGDVESHMNLLLSSRTDRFIRSPEVILSIIEDMISDQLVLRWAAERRPESEENFSHAVKHINEELNLDAFSAQMHEESVPVAESEIRRYFDENKGSFEGKSFAQVRDSIRERLVIEREPEFVENYLEELRAKASITRNFELLDVPPPSSEDLARYYRANLDQFRLPLRAVVDEIEIPIAAFADTAQQRAADILLRLRGGDSFREVAARNPGVKLSENMEVAKGTRSSDWDKSVFVLTQGELGSAFRADESYYVVRPIEFKKERRQTLAEVESDITAALSVQKEKEWFESNGQKTLFTLNGKQYSVDQFYREYRELPVSVRGRFDGPKGLRNLADSLIERMLVVTDTYNKLLDVKTKPIADETRLQLLRQMMEQEEVDDKIAITENDAREYYTKNKQQMSRPPKVRVRYIRVGQGSSREDDRRAHERIEEAYEKLTPGVFQDGADFEEVAREYSEDPISAARGGELPEWIGESDDLLEELSVHPLHQAVLNLEIGEISEPVEIFGSLYIVQVLERIEAKPLSFEEARPYIEEILTDEQHAALASDLQKQLMTEANVTIYQGVLETYFKNNTE